MEELQFPLSENTMVNIVGNMLDFWSGEMLKNFMQIHTLYSDKK